MRINESEGSQKGIEILREFDRDRVRIEERERKRERGSE